MMRDEKNMNLKDILTKAMKKWGLEVQLNMLQEECAELIVATSHYKRCRENSFIELLEEMIDVEILIAQIKLRLVFGTNKYKYIQIKKSKIKRLKERVCK